MKLLIYGAGAVGSYVGAYLAADGHDVVLVTRSGAERISERGLSLRQASGQRLQVQPTAVQTLRQGLLLAEEQPYDYIVLSMKAYDVQAALNQLIAFAPQPPPLVTLQNGIGIEAMLVEQFGAERVVAGSLTTPVSYDNNLNLVEERGDRGLAFAPLAAGSPVKPLVDACRRAGITTELIADPAQMKWSKLLVNIIGNATAAILNRPPGVLYKNDQIYKLEIRMLKEAIEVIQGQNIDIIDLPGAPAKKLVQGLRWMPQGMFKGLLTRQVSKGRGDKMPSFQIDLSSGKDQNEVEFHNGAVAKYGQQLGIATPINSILTEMLTGIAQGELSWEQFDGDVRAFLTAVNARLRARRGN